MSEKSENKRKADTVLLTVIAVATLLVAIVGATFAYFTASVTGNDTASSIIVTTASVGNVVYTAGNKLTLENAYPGATSSTITFTVSTETTTGASYTSAIDYEIKWVNVSNNFTKTTDLVYYLSGTKTSTDGTVVTASAVTCPTASNTTIGTGTLSKSGDKHTYSLYVHYKETASDQNTDQGKTFYGEINVTTSGSDTLYYNSNNTSGTTTAPTSSY